MNLVPLDIVLGIIFLIIVIRCVIRGFVGEFMSALAIVGGIAMAVFVSPMIAASLNELITPTRWTPVIAFLVVFLVVYVVVKLVEKLLDGIFDRLNLERLDKALGLFLGIAEGVVAVCLIVYIIDIQPFFEPATIFEGSRAAEWAHILLPEAAQIEFDLQEII